MRQSSVHLRVVDPRTEPAAAKLARELTSRYRTRAELIRGLNANNTIDHDPGVDATIVFLDAESETLPRFNDASDADRSNAVGIWACAPGVNRPARGSRQTPCECLDTPISIQGRTVDGKSVSDAAAEIGDRFELSKRRLRTRYPKHVCFFAVSVLLGLLGVLGFALDLQSAMSNNSPTQPDPPRSVVATLSKAPPPDPGTRFSNRERFVSEGLVPESFKAFVPGGENPRAGDAFLFSTNQPPEGWDAFGIAIVPMKPGAGGAAYGERLDAQTVLYLDAFDSPETEGAVASWVLEPDRAGAMTAIVVLFPEGAVSAEQWEGTEEWNLGDMIRGSSTGDGSPRIAELPYGMYLRWGQQGYAASGSRGAPTMQARKAAYHNWAELIQRYVQGFDQPFEWGGWSFTVEPPRGGRSLGRSTHERGHDEQRPISDTEEGNATP